MGGRFKRRGYIYIYMYISICIYIPMADSGGG